MVDPKNWYWVVGTVGWAVFIVLCVQLIALLRRLAVWADAEDEWCGCDGEGMAHRRGAEGFKCAAVPDDVGSSRP